MQTQEVLRATCLATLPGETSPVGHLVQSGFRMAIYHLSVKAVSRSQGRSATASAAYRAGAVITCQRAGRTHDYSRKRGITHASLIVPAAAIWATDRSALWNAAEAAENRKNSTVAREYELALPTELSPSDHIAIARAFAQELVDAYGVAADIAIHAPHREGDQRNCHAHILTTTRVAGAAGLTAKTRVLDSQKTGAAEIVRLRETWAIICNRALEAAESKARVTHLSYKARMLETVPTVHIGVAAMAVERRTARVLGEAYQPVTDRMQEHADIVEANQIGEGNISAISSMREWSRDHLFNAEMKFEQRVRLERLAGIARDAKRAADRDGAENLKNRERIRGYVRIFFKSNENSGLSRGSDSKRYGHIIDTIGQLFRKIPRWVSESAGFGLSKIVSRDRD